MKGYFRRRGCTCNKKKCTCGAKWAFTIDVGKDADGKRIQKTRSGFARKEDAEAAAAQLYADLVQGTWVDEKDTRFEEFAPVWLNLYAQTHNVKVSTVRVRDHEMNVWMRIFKGRKLREITRKQYQDALLQLKTDYADNTLSGIHATARMIFKKAVELEIIKVDPTEYAKLPKTQKTVEQLETETDLPKYLEAGELKTFLNTAHASKLPVNYEIFLTLAYTGMRAGELAGLKWSDIDTKENIIKIRRTYYNPNNNTVNYELLPPKTKKSKRDIEVDKIVIDALTAWKSRQKEIKMRKRDVWHDKGFVFTKYDRHPGYPLLIKTIEDRMTDILKLAGLNEALTPHSLRHTHTSLLAEAGATLEEIQDRLGHVDDDTTKRVYLHITKARKKEASRMFSEFMRNL